MNKWCNKRRGCSHVTSRYLRSESRRTRRQEDEARETLVSFWPLVWWLLIRSDDVIPGTRFMDPNGSEPLTEPRIHHSCRVAALTAEQQPLLSEAGRAVRVWDWMKIWSVLMSVTRITLRNNASSNRKFSVDIRVFLSAESKIKMKEVTKRPVSLETITFKM